MDRKAPSLPVQAADGAEMPVEEDPPGVSYFQ